MELRDSANETAAGLPEMGLQNFSGKGDETEQLWIFGYGSLCWHPGFEYQESVTGFIKGFSRRFWQGNTTHRGTENKPGRVVTLVEDQEGVTWGKAFLIAAGDKAALPYLAGRECRLGGYKACKVTFHPRSSSQTENKPVVLYVAIPGNRHWLGSAPLVDIAKQILECNGASGPNAEYLLRLANFMRDEVPEALDEHLFSLERLVRMFAGEMKLCLKSLMGEKDKQEATASSHQFASRIPTKKLRCVNM